MNSNITPRITKEIQRFNTNPVPGISVVPDEANFRHFYAKVAGPVDTPYDGGVFKLEIYLPENYPMDAPKILFRTNIYHPNIDKLGRICLDILKTNWTPALQINSVLVSLQSLLGAPNLDDPLDESIANHWKMDSDDAIKTAK